MTREQHLHWAMNRALEYVERGDLPQAFTSLASDLGKHPDTARDESLAQRVRSGMMLLIGGELSTAVRMREYIQGFR